MARNEQLDEIAKSLSRKCHKEFVGLSEVRVAVEQAISGTDAEEIREASLEVAGFILKDPDLVVGQFNEIDFEEWDDDASTTLKRIASAWKPPSNEAEPGDVIWFAKRGLEFDSTRQAKDELPTKAPRQVSVDAIATVVGIATAAVLFGIQLLRDVEVGNLTIPLIVTGSFLLSFLAIGRAGLALVRRDEHQARALRTAYIAIVVGWFYVPYLADGAPTTTEVFRTNRTALEFFGDGPLTTAWMLTVIGWVSLVLVGLPATILMATLQYWLTRTVGRETIAWLLLLAGSLGLLYFGGSLLDWVLD